jgi:hypothetical protein
MCPDCPVCVHPARLEIDAALLNHRPDGEVSVRWRLNRLDVARHLEEHLDRCVELDRSDLVARVRRVEAAAWDAYSRALEQVDDAGHVRIGNVCTALREVRGALETEAKLFVGAKLTPQESSEPDLRVVIQAELRTNPALVAHALSMMSKNDARALLLGIAPDIVDSPTEPTDGPGCAGMVPASQAHQHKGNDNDTEGK